MDIYKCIKKLKPTSVFSVNANDINQVVYYDETIPVTLQECEDVWQTIKTDIENARMKAARSAAYESEIDPLKWEMDEAYARGNTAVGDTLKAQWLAGKDEIRERYPY